MNTLINLGDKRPSVFYTVTIEHRWDGTFGLSISGIGDDPTPRSRNSVASTLLEVIKVIDPSVLVAYLEKMNPNSGSGDFQ